MLNYFYLWCWNVRLQCLLLNPFKNTFASKMQLRNIKSYNITVKEFILPFYGKIKKKTVSSELKLLFSYVSVLKSAEVLYENPFVGKNHSTHLNNEAQPLFLMVLLHTAVSTVKSAGCMLFIYSLQMPFSSH